MLDVELVLAYDGSARIAEQFIVVEQGSGNSILNGYHADDRRVTLHVLEHLLESGAANELYLFTFEMLVGCHVVERTDESLYCYSFHFLPFI